MKDAQNGKRQQSKRLPFWGCFKKDAKLKPLEPHDFRGLVLLCSGTQAIKLSMETAPIFGGCKRTEVDLVFVPCVGNITSNRQ